MENKGQTQLPEELIRQRLKYYTDPAVLFELLKAMRDREVILMHKTDNWRCTRGLFVRNIDYLKLILSYFKVNKFNYNIYVSVAKYKWIRNFPLDLTIRSKYTKEWFANECKTSMKSYDIFFDFDIDGEKEMKQGKKDILKITRALNHHEVPYNVYPSGSGFQMNIPGEVLDYRNCDQTVKFIKEFTKRVKLTFNLKTLCMKGIGHPAKIRKCEYSLVEDKLIFPLSEDNLSNFEYYEYAHITSEILLKQGLTNRGLMYHNKIKNDDIQLRFKRFREEYFL